MAVTGSSPPRSPTGRGQVLAFLAEVRRAGGRLRVEDARGREVPAGLDRVAETGLVLRPEGPLDLKPGNKIHLVFLLRRSRFRAGATVLEAGAGGLAVTLPRAVVPAERRKKARGVLQVVLWGLVSPLASAAPPPEPTAYYEYEPGRPAAVLRPLSSPGPGPEAPPLFQAPQWPRPARSPNLHPVVSYLQDQLEARLTSLNARALAPKPVWPEPPVPVLQRRHGGLLAHGCSFHFLPITLPGSWRGSQPFHTMRFEVHVDRENIQIGLRIK